MLTDSSPETPYVAVDRDVLERNLARMAESTAARGLDLRPHAKTHKCLEIGCRQLELGAVGLTVATVGEAEVFAEICDDLLIAYPVWADERRGRRLRAVAERTRLAVGVESIEAAARLGAAVGGLAVAALVEVDSGHHRTGVAPDDVVEVATAAARAGLHVGGIFTFPGHGYAPDARAAAAYDEVRALDRARTLLGAAGFDVAVRSGGSTPTANLSRAGILTEVRPGVYAFGDAQQVELGSAAFADVALTVVATVVAAHGPRLVLDAGSKSLGADRPVWATGWGRLPDVPDARITAVSEHHATVTWPADLTPPAPGALVRVAPNHVCATVNLADELIVVDGGAVVDVWPVAARGRNS